MIKIGYENLVTTASIFSANASGQFPLSNLKDDRRSKVFRSTSEPTAIVFDFGTARDLNTFYMVDSKIAPFGFLGIRLKLNNVNAWDVPPVDVIPQVDYLNGFAWFEWPEMLSYRFARIELDSNLDYCEISKVFLGERIEGETLAIDYPIDFKILNLANISKNRYNQRFIDEITSIKILRGQISNLYKEELEDLARVFDYISTTRPLWFNICDDFPIDNPAAWPDITI